MPPARPTHTVDSGRRRMLQLLAAAPAVLTTGLRSQAALANIALQPDRLAPRDLSLVSTHTRESAQVIFFENGGYVPDALHRLNRLLRDHRTGEVASIDPQLFDLLHDLARAAGCAPRYEIISGYRTPATNENLRKASTGVATRSLHMEGRALDVRLAGCSTARLRDLALGLQRGGVGYYKKSDFVHVDTGRVRSWTG